MNDQNITFTAEPPPTRWTYFKTALILLVVGEVMNVFAQMRLVQQKEEYKFSSIILAVLSLVISYFLSRSPLTKSLTIDYAKRLVVVGFATLTKTENTLGIPFVRLGVDTDAPTNTASPDAKWRTHLLLDGKKVYLLLSSESGFTSAQMNEFNERVKECQEGASFGKSLVFSAVTNIIGFSVGLFALFIALAIVLGMSWEGASKYPTGLSAALIGLVLAVLFVPLLLIICKRIFSPAKDTDWKISAAFFDCQLHFEFDNFARRANFIRIFAVPFFRLNFI